MEQKAVVASILNATLVVVATLALFQGVEGIGIGVNYGTVANNLPPPTRVAKFLSKSTTINRVRLFDANPEIIHAFGNTRIEVTITVPNDQIPHITNITFAQQWVKINVQPFIPKTKLIRILVGNEVLSTANKLLISNLVPAMQTLHTALVAASLDKQIKVSTPHSLGILSNSSPPSSAKFRQGYDTHVIKPMLSFLKDSNSPFMVNPYPFFGCSSSTLDYAIFKTNYGLFDYNTNLHYTNMLDAQLDAVYSAMKVLGFEDVEIVIAETGWPSLGDPAQVGVDPKTASEYNGNLIRHVTSGSGTPLMPNRTFDTYIFALFDENLKPGPTCERNFGLFWPNMTPVYEIPIMKNTVDVLVLILAKITKIKFQAWNIITRAEEQLCMCVPDPHGGMVFEDMFKVACMHGASKFKGNLPNTQAFIFKLRDLLRRPDITRIIMRPRVCCGSD